MKGVIMENEKDIVEETTAFLAAEEVELQEEQEDSVTINEGEEFAFSSLVLDNDEENDSGSEEPTVGGLDEIIEEASTTEEVTEKKSKLGFDNAVPSYGDAPPPDLSQVGKRLDTHEHWYVLHTFNGYEAVAEDNLKKVVEKYGLQDRVKEIFIPTEEVVVEKKNKKVLVPTRTMPSYIFVKMIYGDDLWHTITRTRGITGFVGPKGRPLPLTPREVISMKLERKINISVDLEEGDTVQVVDGPLAGQTAHIISVDAAAKKCSATVNMFGRPTNVELAFSQVKKI